MGPPPSMQDMEAMLDNPMFLSQMQEMMNNPAFLEIMEQNPVLRDNPMARQLFRDPTYRRMLLDPQLIRAQLRAQRAMNNSGGGSFPAPGVTDTTPEGQTRSTEGADSGAGLGAGAGAGAAAGGFPPGFASLFGNPGGAGAGGAGGAANPFAALFGTPPPASPSAGSGATGQNTSPASTGTNPATAANPFGNLFGNLPPPEDFRNMMQALGGLQPPVPGAGGEGAAEGAPGANPAANADSFAALNRLLSNPDFMQAFGNAGGAGNPFGGAGFGQTPAQPADTRPPEERYAEQLRQLNDMGFYEFERNVEALRRSGGSVQGAIEYLLSG
jgi:ubiquilin